MRPVLLVLLAALAGCSPQGGSDNAMVPSAVRSITPDVAQPGKLRGNEAATSASAYEARKTVQHYFDLIKARNYADAYRLWGDGGADTRGSEATFAAQFDQYSQYYPEVGVPTAITATGDEQYVQVLAKLRVKLKKDGTFRDRSGVVMLRRHVDPAQPVADKRDWRIWGTDIRVRH